jgi:hypothetical protein
LLENLEPSSIILESSPCVRWTSCRRDMREASSAVVASESLFRSPCCTPFWRISQTSAWCCVWCEKIAGCVWASGSGRSHLSSQKNVFWPLLTAHWVMALSVGIFLNTSLAKEELCFPWCSARGDWCVIQCLQGVSTFCSGSVFSWVAISMKWTRTKY